MLGMLELAILFTACTKSDNQSLQAMDPSKIPQTVSQAFNQSPDETKQVVAGYVVAFQQQDVPTAFTQLQKVSDRDDLTPQQRAVVAGAMLTTIKQLQVSAQNGNSAAQAALHQYTINK